MIEPGQIRIFSVQDPMEGEPPTGSLYTVIGPTEKPGVWQVLLTSGEVDRWWYDGILNDVLVGEEHVHH